MDGDAKPILFYVERETASAEQPHEEEFDEASMPRGSGLVPLIIASGIHWKTVTSQSACRMQWKKRLPLELAL